MSYRVAMRAIVTGANRGIGLELVRQLVASGAEVDAEPVQTSVAGAELTRRGGVSHVDRISSGERWRQKFGFSL